MKRSKDEDNIMIRVGTKKEADQWIKDQQKFEKEAAEEYARFTVNPKTKDKDKSKDNKEETYHNAHPQNYYHPKKVKRGSARPSEKRSGCSALPNAKFKILDGRYYKRDRRKPTNTTGKKM